MSSKIFANKKYVYCSILSCQYPDVCCHLDTNTITNKETNYNIKAIYFGYIYHKLTFKITRMPLQK